MPDAGGAYLAAGLAVAVGGGIGGALRYKLNAWVESRLGGTFPWGTLTVNGVGSAVIGAVLALAVQGADAGSAPGWLLPFLAIGFCGAFTTVSSFAVQSVDLFERGELGRALCNIGGSLLLALVAVLTGFALAGGDLASLAQVLERGGMG